MNINQPNNITNTLGDLYEFLHNNCFAKIGREYAEELEQNRDTSDETKNNNEPEENKQNFIDSKENIIKNATQLKENGVDKFKSGMYFEALKLFNQAQKILERDLAEEIKNKAPFVLEIYIKTISYKRNLNKCFAQLQS